MVAVVQPSAAPGAPIAGGARRGWLLAAGAALAGGIVARVALGGGGTGDLSAAVMLSLLASSAWVAALLLATPRTAFCVALALIVLLDLAALPARDPPEYDALEAFYRTDQVIAAEVVGAPGVSAPTLTLLVEPIFPAGQAAPRFGLAGEVGGTPLVWDCTFERGRQRLGLPLPPAIVGNGGSPLPVRLRLTGAPSRETDYLLVYQSARRGGFVMDLVGAAPAAATTPCQPR